MTTTIEDTSTSFEEIALQRAASEIKSINDVILKSYLDAADSFGMLSYIDPARVDAYVAKHAGMAPLDMERLRKLWFAIAGPLSKHAILLRGSGISIEAIDALADAPEQVQRAVVKMLNAGKIVRVDQIAVLRERHDVENTPEWRRRERHRTTTLESLAAPALKARIAKLESKARDVANELYRFDEYWSDGSFDDDQDLYELCHRSLVSDASDARREFEAAFGTEEALLALQTEDATFLAAAGFALKQVSEGGFGYGKGLALHRDVGVGSLLLADAVSQLVPIYGYDPTLQQSHASLKVLELCAGAGGMSLGLQASGFEHVALYDNYKPSIKTLSANQPHWPVHHGDVQKLTNEDLSRFANVDLLAAGLPCGPGETIKKRPDLLPRMIELLGLIKPASFIFENDAGARKKPATEMARTDAVSAMTAAGYVVTDFSLDTADFGLPHSTGRHFLVGIRSDLPGVFEVPKIKTKSIEERAREYAKAKSDEERIRLQNEVFGYRRGVGGVMSPVIIAHESPRSLRNGRSPQQKIYDQWATDWRGDFYPALLPDIPYKQEKRSNWGKGWLSAGFDRSWIVENPPSVDEVTGSHFRPRLTFAALAAAQGFPAPWKFLATGSEKLPMIQAALPPVMARMVGLALRTALTGESFDLDKEVEVSVIEDSKVGPQPIKRSSALALRSRQWNLPRTEIFDQAMRVLRGEELKVVEPDRLLRAPIKHMMTRVKKERARLEEQSRLREVDDADPWDASAPLAFYAPKGSRFAKKEESSSDHEQKP
ncbi:DNA cytosine methyltransferase [Rhizobium leguminosarum]